MEQAEYIEALQGRWPKGARHPEPRASTLDLANRAVQEHPRCAKLWIIRGNLLELANIETHLPLKESERCYRTAIKIDPFNIEAYQDLAWFLDGVLGKRRKAKRFFDKARRLRLSVDGRQP